MNNVGSTTLLHPVFINLEQLVIFRRVELTSHRPGFTEVVLLKRLFIQVPNHIFLSQELDETWKGMRWLLDILHYSRDRESVSGIPLDLVFDTRRPCSPEPYDSHRKHSERKSSTTASNGEKN